MTDPAATIAGLRKIRTYLLETLAEASDEIAAIDAEIEKILQGNRGQGGAAV